MKIISFRRNVVFLKLVILVGGLTLEPRYKMQPSINGDLPPKHVASFIVMRKS